MSTPTSVLSTVPEKLRLKCPFCKPSSYYNSVDELSRHKNCEHKKARLRCFFCDFSCHKLSKWARHLKKKHSTQYSRLSSLGLGTSKPQRSRCVSKSVCKNVSVSNNVSDCEKVHVQNLQTKLDVSETGESKRKQKHSRKVKQYKDVMQPDHVSDCEKAHVQSLQTTQTDGSESKRKQKHSRKVKEYKTVTPPDNASDCEKLRVQSLQTKHTEGDKKKKEARHSRKFKQSKHVTKDKESDSNDDDVILVEEDQNSFDGDVQIVEEQNSCISDSEVIEVEPGTDDEDVILIDDDQVETECVIDTSGELCQDIDSQTIDNDLQTNLYPVDKEASPTVDGMRTTRPKHKVIIDQIPDATDKNKWISQDKDGRFSCIKCIGKTFESRKEIQKHISLHCQYCSHVSSSVTYLKFHEYIHSGEKPFACQYCNYRTNFPGYMITHMRYHNNIRPFPCPSCDHRAKTSSDLKYHIRTHTGEKPYGCNNCGRRFTHAFSLGRHIRGAVCH